jgi:hypothetical protein
VNEARRKKLRANIAANLKAVRFDDLIGLTEAYGYVCKAPRGGSSHYTCRKPGRSPIGIAKPRSKHVKITYVKIALSETEDLENGNA